MLFFSSQRGSLTCFLRSCETPSPAAPWAPWSASRNVQCHPPAPVVTESLTRGGQMFASGEQWNKLFGTNHPKKCGKRNLASLSLRGSCASNDACGILEYTEQQLTPSLVAPHCRHHWSAEWSSVWAWAEFRLACQFSQKIESYFSIWGNLNGKRYDRTSNLGCPIFKQTHI